MNVDDYKKKYVDAPLISLPPGFFEVGTIAPTPVMQVRFHELIEEAVDKLNLIYVPGAWLWMRLKNKHTYEELRSIESAINTAVEIENEDMLKEALNNYYEMWVVILEAFKPEKDIFVPF